MKAEPSRLIPRKSTENLELLFVKEESYRSDGTSVAELFGVLVHGS